MVRAPDAAAQLVQLRKPHVVGAVDHDGIGGGHVDAALDDGGAHQDVEAPMVEVHHQLLELALAHLAVADAHDALRDQRLHLGGDLVDRAHLVVHEVDLAAAAQLAQGRLAQGRRVPLDQEGLDGQARRRRGGDEGQVAQPAQGHVERARDGGRGEGEHVHVGAQGLQALLVAHAEAVLLVDDEQAQVLEARMGVQQAVRGDDDVDAAGLKAGQRRGGLARVAEARKPLHAHRQVGEAVAEVAQVLLHQKRRGRKHRHLLAGLGGSVRGAHGDLGLAEADIAAHDAVHRALAGKIGEHGADGLRLVLGLLEREGARQRPGSPPRSPAGPGPAAPCGARTDRAAPRPRRGSARRRGGAPGPTGRCRACAAGHSPEPRPCSGSPGAAPAPARRCGPRPGTPAPGTPPGSRRCAWA